MKINLITIKAYNEVAEEYADDSMKWAAPDFIDNFINALPKKAKVVDVGCGGGRDVKTLTDRGFEVTGIDASTKLIEYAGKHFPNINFQVADMRDIPFPDQSFNGVWCQAALLHLELAKDVKKAISEFGRVLKPNGILHLYNKAHVKGPKTEILTNYFFKNPRFFRYFTTEEMTELLNKAGFSLLINETYEETERTIAGRKGVFWIYTLAKKSGK